MNAVKCKEIASVDALVGGTRLGAFRAAGSGDGDGDPTLGSAGDIAAAAAAGNQSQTGVTESSDGDGLIGGDDARIGALKRVWYRRLRNLKRQTKQKARSFIRKARRAAARAQASASASAKKNDSGNVPNAGTKKDKDKAARYARKVRRLQAELREIKKRLKCPRTEQLLEQQLTYKRDFHRALYEKGLFAAPRFFPRCLASSSSFAETLRDMAPIRLDPQSKPVFELPERDSSSQSKRREHRAARAERNLSSVVGMLRACREKRKRLRPAVKKRQLDAQRSQTYQLLRRKTRKLKLLGRSLAAKVREYREKREAASGHDGGAAQRDAGTDATGRNDVQARKTRKLMELVKAKSIEALRKMPRDQLRKKLRQGKAAGAKETREASSSVSKSMSKRRALRAKAQRKQRLVEHAQLVVAARRLKKARRAALSAGETLEETRKARAAAKTAGAGGSALAPPPLGTPLKGPGRDSSRSGAPASASKGQPGETLQGTPNGARQGQDAGLLDGGEERDAGLEQEEAMEAAMQQAEEDHEENDDFLGGGELADTFGDADAVDFGEDEGGEDGDD